MATMWPKMAWGESLTCHAWSCVGEILFTVWAVILESSEQPSIPSIPSIHFR